MGGHGAWRLGKKWGVGGTRWMFMGISCDFTEIYCDLMGL